MKLLTFPEPARFDLAEALHALADKYASGELTMPEAFAYVAESEGGLSCGLLGLTSEIHATGLFHIAANFMAEESVGDE